MSGEVKRDKEFEISDAEFERLRDFFYQKTGIYFEESKRYFVDKRVFERMREVDHPTFRSYFTFLRFQASQQELQKLTNLLTVNETYFFREEYQFKSLVNDVLNNIAESRKPGDTIRIWTVPCSTGEEAYSVAIYLLEKWYQIETMEVEIVASDIDTSVLEKCREGIYTSRSIQYIPHGMIKKYFKKVGANEFHIVQDLKDVVDFCRVNISDPQMMRLFRKFDVIFCRNLLIYFDEPSRLAAVELLYDALNPGGYLYLGHTESMSRISSLFHVIKTPDAIVYQKPFKG